jgi:glycosyltransferase involved in cell wall biosynthesis
MVKRDYVLITAAYNEEEFIALTIESVISQIVLPTRWVIVSDASTDRTDEIVESYCFKYPFIRLLRITEDHPRNFAAQVNAIMAGYAALQDMDYSFIGNLDSDISFGPTYFRELLERFDFDPQLGLGGGCVKDYGVPTSRKIDTQSVPHATQLFRRACFEVVGGYLPLAHGATDTVAEVTARMKGWSVACFPELEVTHHRYMASAEGILSGRVRQGFADVSIGTHPAFLIAKCVRRVDEKPYLVGAFVRLGAFVYAHLRGDKPLVSEEFVKFLRAEQIAKLRQSFLP